MEFHGVFCDPLHLCSILQVGILATDIFLPLIKTHAGKWFQCFGGRDTACRVPTKQRSIKMYKF